MVEAVVTPCNGGHAAKFYTCAKFSKYVLPCKNLLFEVHQDSSKLGDLMKV